MRAMLIPVGGYPREIDVESYDDIESILGGKIVSLGHLFMDEPRLYAIAGAEKSCTANRLINGQLVYGNALAIGFDPFEGELCDLTNAEVKWIKCELGTPASVMSGKLEALRLRRKMRKR